MLVNDEQNENKYHLIVVVEGGIDTFFSFLQPEKVPPSKVVKDGEISMLVKEEQSLKAHWPISVTDEGIFILCKEEHLLNTNSEIKVTDSGISILVSEEQPINTQL